jgi:hypothetical protein
MIRKPKLIAGMVLGVCVALVGSACAIYDGGHMGQINVQTEAQKIIDKCELTNEEIYLVDLTGDGFRRYIGRNYNCEKVREYIKKRRENGTQDPLSMLYMPFDESLPFSISGVRYVLIDTAHDEPNTVWGSFVAISEATATNGNSYTAWGYWQDLRPVSGMSGFVSQLQPLEDWTVSDPDADLPTETFPDNFGWQIAVIDADYALHRWGGGGGSIKETNRQMTVPKGFTQIYDAFKNLK